MVKTVMATENCENFARQAGEKRRNRAKTGGKSIDDCALSTSPRAFPCHDAEK